MSYAVILQYVKILFFDFHIFLARKYASFGHSAYYRNHYGKSSCLREMYGKATFTSESRPAPDQCRFLFMAWSGMVGLRIKQLWLKSVFVPDQLPLYRWCIPDASTLQSRSSWPIWKITTVDPEIFARLYFREISVSDLFASWNFRECTMSPPPLFKSQTLSKIV